MDAASPAHFLVTLNLDGQPTVLGGGWMRKTGGNGTSTLRRFRPGGSDDEEVTGGPTSRDDMTLSREFRPDRDRDAVVWLDRNRGKVSGSVSIQPLAADMSKFGNPLVLQCRLMGVNAPEVNSDGGTDVAMLEVQLATFGSIA